MTNEYIRKLTDKYPQMREIWLIGSRANDQERQESDWDYVAFADSTTLEQLRADTDLNEPNIDLLVVHNGDSFESPWVHEGQQQKRGSLTDWEWRAIPDNPRLAMYANRGEKVNQDGAVLVTRVPAKMIWPPAD